MNTRNCAVDLVIIRVEISALHHQRATVDDLLHVQNEIVLLCALVRRGAWSR
jgi:hypothetical protein